VEAIRGHYLVRVRGIDRLGFIPLWIRFDITCKCSGEQLEGMRERIAAWSAGVAKVKISRSRWINWRFP
jgi:hypothetical protein